MWPAALNEFDTPVLAFILILCIFIIACLLHPPDETQWDRSLVMER